MPEAPWKKTAGERVALFRRFYARENERPLFGFYAGSEYPLFRYGAARSLTEGRPLTPADIDIAPYLDDCDRLWEAHEACGGDFIWSGTPFWGIPWMEALLGLDLYADHGTGSISARAPASFTGPDAVPGFDPDGPWAVVMRDFFAALAARSAGKWPLATTRMRGVADLLAALYGGDGFVLAMLDRPDEVRATAERLTDLWLDCARFQLEHIPPFHDGVGSFYYAMWAPPGTVWHQEDAVALLSPDLYDEFIAPCDRRIVAGVPSCIMHQHPAGFVPVGRYIDMGFTALEMHIDTGGPSATDLHDRHMALLERGPLLIWGDIPGHDLDRLFTRLPHRGLAVMTVVDSPGRAKELWRRCMS